MRGLEDRVAVHRDEGLVRGDDVLASFDGFVDEPESGVGAADELDDDIDVRVADDLARIGGERECVGRADARPVERAYRGSRDHDVTAGPARDLLAVSCEHVDGAAADGSEAEHSDSHGGHSPKLRSPNPR